LIAGGDLDGGGDLARVDGQICRDGGPDEEFEPIRFGGAEAGGLDGDAIRANGEEIEAVLASTIGGCGALAGSAFVGGGDGGVSDRSAGGIGDGTDDVAARGCLRVEVVRA